VQPSTRLARVVACASSSVQVLLPAPVEGFLFSSAHFRLRHLLASMARSHIAVALGAALIASLIIAQLVVNLGFPVADFWHGRLDQTYTGAQQDHFTSEKQDPGLADDASSYLIGVGKADITGWVA
jgi:hypothetical protein